MANEGVIANFLPYIHNCTHTNTCAHTHLYVAKPKADDYTHIRAHATINTGAHTHTYIYIQICTAYTFVNKNVFIISDIYIYIV